MALLQRKEEMYFFCFLRYNSFFHLRGQLAPAPVVILYFINYLLILLVVVQEEEGVQDGRSLYERLQAQKELKKEELEEQLKFSKLLR